MNESLIFDGVLAVLLLIAILGGVQLQKRIRLLQQQQVALDVALQEFRTATTQAEQAITHLKLATDTTVQLLRQPVQQAEAMKQDLEFLVSRADAAAQQIEESLRQSRKIKPATVAASAHVPVADPQPAPQRVYRSRAEEDLLKALQKHQPA